MTIEASSPNTYIIYSNIKVGPINSTFSAGNVTRDSDYISQK
jgi:cellulose 1,4-beta-cellobiosidase